MPAKSSCSVILIHGIGDQKENWSEDFRKALKAELGPSFNRLKLADAYWAPFSTIDQLLHPSLAPSPEAEGAALESDIYNQTRQQLQRALDAEAKPPAGAMGFGPGDVAAWFKGAYEDAKSVLDDIGNYLARNGVRTAVQNVLHSKLGDAERLKGPVLLVSHSQGTVISYDVLRQAGGNYPHLHTWITMGSPLRKFYLSNLKWGKKQLGMPSDLRWVNLYDPKDFVGNELKGALEWASPVPEDHMVDNVKNAGGAHNHWKNPEVVRIVADEIRKLLV
jgi:hypothetical protein